MKATKGNKVYTIDEAQQAIYQAQGYDILDDQGEVIQYGAGKSVSYEQFKKVSDEATKLKTENKKLKDKIKELEKNAQ